MSNQRVNLAQALDYLELILGKDWLEENLKIVKDGRYGHGGFGRHIDFTSFGIAHAYKIWYKAREETIGMEIAGDNLPGPYSLIAAAMAADIKVLKNNAGLKSIVEALKDPELSLTAMHQLAIAAGYAQKSYKIIFTGPNAWDGPVFSGNAGPVGVFTALGENKEVMVMCCDINKHEVSSERISSIENYLYSQGVQAGERIKQWVLYLHVGDTLKEYTNLLYQWATYAENNRLIRDYGMPVLVYTTGIKNITNRPVYVRWGRLVKGSNEAFLRDVYVPDEIIIPDMQ